MKLEIKLKDPKCCDGCPARRKIYGFKDFWCFFDGDSDKLLTTRIIGGKVKPIRPQKCIKENGR